ncbi:MAG TPA: dTDP-4-dehydrorhamnose reductase [Pyrinomonadaceae bacterium]
MKIVITGANGMVAGAVAEHCRKIGDVVVALRRQELDISDRDAVFATLTEHSPDAVLNCAAYTDVDGAETNAEESRAANTLGVRYLAEATRETGSRLVTISTDYVFDGAKTDFYTEDDLPDPQGVYAVTKYEGELAAVEADPTAIVVRSGWIYGEGGTNFLSVMHKLLAAGKKIKAIDDAYGTPTFARHLATRLRVLAGLGERGIFHVTNSGPGTTYFGFAEKICEIGGFDRKLVERVSHSDLKRPAPRPVSSKLATVRMDRLGLDPLPDWETALAAFLSEKSGKR